jgi:hypothetical protein
MPLVQSDPTSMLRGAIQHRIPVDSSWLQIASAIDLSLLEWLIKTLGSIPVHEPCSRFGRQWRDGTVAVAATCLSDLSGGAQMPACFTRTAELSRRTLQVRNAWPAQNAPHYQPLLPKNFSQCSRAIKHREHTIRFAARGCGYSVLWR